jgi:hypothetical protein
MPFDAQAQRESGELGLERSSALANLSTARQTEQEESGLGAGGSSPYSAAALLKRQRDNGQRGVLTTAGNQLYSGSTLNKSRAVGRNYDEGMKQLEAQDARAQAAYERGTAETNQAYQLGSGGIKEGAIKRAEATEPPPLAAGRGRGRGRGRGGQPQRRRRGRMQ